MNQTNSNKYETDFELWKALKENKEDALNIIYKTHYQSLYNYGRKFANDDEFIRDMVQETFYDIIRLKNNLSDTDNIRFYLLRSLRNKIVKELKKLVVREKYHLEIKKINFEPYFTVENSLIFKENRKSIREKLANALNSLTERQKEAIYLKYYHNLDYEEICEIMSINYQSARTLIYKAIKDIKDNMEAFGLNNIFFYIYMSTFGEELSYNSKSKIMANYKSC